MVWSVASWNDFMEFQGFIVISMCGVTDTALYTMEHVFRWIKTQ